MKRLLLLLALTGCATPRAASTPPPPAGPICRDPIIEDWSTVPWDTRDWSTFEFAKTRCGRKFPKSPCLYKFLRREPGAYRVTCGEATKH